MNATITTFFITYLSLVSPLCAELLTLSCPHKKIFLQVELAQTPAEQEKGLMYRRLLGETEGMLFLYPSPRPVAMWMKNTHLSLDMIFCNPEGKILAIHEKATPHSLKTIGPVEGTTQVLEVLSGTIQKHQITSGCTLMLNPEENGKTLEMER
jgi:uncharacterized membrane protein (UPF0127 family)